MADFDLGTARGKIEIDASGAERGMRNTGRAVDDLEGRTSRAHGSMLALSKAAAAVGAAGLAGFGLAVKSAADFEKTMSGVKAVSGASAQEMEKLRKKALQLGADTAFSAGESGLAMEELVKAGLSVEDVLNGAADATVNLAAAGEVDLPTAATIAANAMNQFGLSAEQMPRVADLIAGAANASAIDVNDFGMAMSQAGATANLVGLSFDDLALAITAMGNAGIKGSDAGTSLKTFMANLQPTTEKQIQLMDDLGLINERNATAMNVMGSEFFTAEGKIRPMSEIAGTLATALEGMSEAQKMATLEVLFGSDAIRAAAIIANEGATGMDGLAASMGKVTAADVAATRMDNLYGSLEQLKGSIETLLIQVGTPFLGWLRNVADEVTKVVNKLGEMDPETRNMIVGITAATTAFIGLAGAMGIIGHAMSPAISAIGSMIGVVLRMNIVLLASPWFWVAAAIAALVAGLIYAYKNFDSFRQFVDKAWEAIKDFGKGIKEWWENTALPAIRGFADFWAENVQPKIEAFINWLLPILQSIGDFMMNTVLPIVVGAVEAVVGAIQGIVDWITNTFIPAVQSVWEPFKAILMDVWAWIEEHVIPTARAIIDFIIVIIKDLIWFIELTLVPAIKLAFKIIQEVIEFLWPVVERVFNGIKLVIETTLNVIKDIIEFIVNGIKAFWRAFGDEIMAVTKFVWDGIVLIIETLLGIIRGIFEFFAGLFSLDWEKMWNGIKTIAETIWNFIAGAFQLLVDGIMIAWELFKSGLQFAWDLFWGAIKLTAETIWEGIKLVVSLAIEFIEGVITTFIDAVQLAWDLLWAAIETIVTTAWDVIKDVVDKGLQFIKDLWDDVVGGLDDAWDAVWDAIGASIEWVWEHVIKPVIDTMREAFEDVKSAWREVTTLGGVFKPGIEQGTWTPINNARGGIVTQQTLSWLAEKNKPEVVIPLTDNARALELMNASGLSKLFADNYAKSLATYAPFGVTSVTNVTEGNRAAVHIDEAHFHDDADIDQLVGAAEMAVANGSL